MHYVIDRLKENYLLCGLIISCDFKVAYQAN